MCKQKAIQKEVLKVTNEITKLVRKYLSIIKIWKPKIFKLATLKIYFTRQSSKMYSLTPPKVYPATELSLSSAKRNTHIAEIAPKLNSGYLIILSFFSILRIYHFCNQKIIIILFSLKIFHSYAIQRY